MKRRAFIGSLVSLIAAPAIVRASSLMPISSRLLKPGFSYISAVIPAYEYSTGKIDYIIRGIDNFGRPLEMTTSDAYYDNMLKREFFERPINTTIPPRNIQRWK